MYIYYQANPQNKRTDDCVVRAISKALDIDWDTASIYLIIQQIRDSDIYTKNYVWGNLLTRNGFTRHFLPNTCPDCYTIAQFADEHKDGTYVVGTGDHVVAVIEGDFWDTFDSGDMIPLVYYKKERSVENGL